VEVTESGFNIEEVMLIFLDRVCTCLAPDRRVLMLWFIGIYCMQIVRPYINNHPLFNGRFLILLDEHKSHLGSAVRQRIESMGGEVDIIIPGLFYVYLVGLSEHRARHLLIILGKQ
jgi:hypothetical protein